MNALKHGLDARTIVLPGEDEAAFRARRDAWMAEHKPRTPKEEELLERAVGLSWQLDRAIAVQAAQATERIRRAQSDDARREQDEADAAEAAAVGRKLLDGPPAPKFNLDKFARRLAMLYASPFWSQYTPVGDVDRIRGKRLVMPVHPDDAEHPARLLRRLEATAAGYRWLLDRWGELRDALEAGACWTPTQRLAAVRLLGQEPVDALEDPRVQAIYLASFVLDPAGPRVFTDQAVETTRREFDCFLQLLGAQGARERKPRSREAARAGLRALVDGVVGVLEVRLAGYEARAAARAETAVDRLAFDTTAEGDRRQRLQTRLLHALFRTIDELKRARRRPEAPAPRPEPPRSDDASPAVPAACGEIRNEPIAAPGPARLAIRNAPDADAAPAALGERDEPGASGLATRGEPDADAANPYIPLICEGIWNEPNAPAGPAALEADARSGQSVRLGEGPMVATRSPDLRIPTVTIAASRPASSSRTPRPRPRAIRDGDGPARGPWAAPGDRLPAVAGTWIGPPGSASSPSGARPAPALRRHRPTDSRADPVRSGRPPPPRDEAPGGTWQTSTGPAKPATDRRAGPIR